MSGRVCILTPDPADEGYRTRWREVLERNAGPLRSAGLARSDHDPRLREWVRPVPGLEPTRTTFGLVPIYGHDVWLHAVLALIAAYFGWVNRDTAGDRI